MSSTDFQRIAILGPGLLGGSLAQCLQSRRPDVTVHLWARREAALEAPRKDHVAALLSTRLAEVLEGAEAVILCTPVTAMPDLVRDAAPHLAPGTLVTDVGSVKGWLQERIPPLLPAGVEWLGAHPMAGRESGGYESATPDLYQDSVTLLTPVESTPAALTARLSAFWTSVGCRVQTLSPLDHDRQVARVSHLPHLLSAILMETTPPEALSCAGPGFRDATRIAAGPADLWETIFRTNRDAVLDAAEDFSARWEQSSGLLRKGEFDKLTEILDRASGRRRELNHE